MSRTKRFTNPIAVAMKNRHGKTTSVMHDRRQPRGGQRNEMRDFLDEYEEEQAILEQATLNSFLHPDFKY